MKKSSMVQSHHIIRLQSNRFIVSLQLKIGNDPISQAIHVARHRSEYTLTLNDQIRNFMDLHFSNKKRWFNKIMQDLCEELDR